MDSIKDDKYYIDRMKIHFERVLDITANVSFDEYSSSIDKQDITMFNLIQISENAKRFLLNTKIKIKIFLGQISMVCEIR